jgi:hypothetical protein
MYSGAAYVYISNGNQWSFKAKLYAPSGASSDSFGVAVSVYDTIAIIGATGDDDMGTDSGKLNAAIVNEKYLRTFTLLPYSASKLTIGSTYRYSFNGNAWSFVSKIIAPDGFGQAGVGYDNFGSSVSQYTTTALIGAMGDGDRATGAGTVNTKI